MACGALILYLLSMAVVTVAENTTTAAELEDPEPVDCSQMVISGSWNSFRLSWTPSPAQENTKVTYKIILTYGVNNKQEIKIVSTGILVVYLVLSESDMCITIIYATFISMWPVSNVARFLNDNDAIFGKTRCLDQSRL